MTHKQRKQRKIHRKFFKSPRLEISRVLIEELTGWESAKVPTEEEFLHLIERLAIIIHDNLDKLIMECVNAQRETDGRDSFYLESDVFEEDGHLIRKWRAMFGTTWEGSEKEYSATPTEAVQMLLQSLNKNI